MDDEEISWCPRIRRRTRVRICRLHLPNGQINVDEAVVFLLPPALTDDKPEED
jgi:hypothetical protein